MSAHDLRRAIEPLKAKARAARRRQVEPLALLARLDAAQQLAALLEPLLGPLCDTLSGVIAYRRLGGESWIIGAAGRETVPVEGRRPRSAVSRLELRITVADDGRSLRLACHRTTLDRDLDVERLEVPLPLVDDRGPTAWGESCCLDFARAMWARRAETRSEWDPSASRPKLG